MSASDALAAIRRIAGAVSVPVTADFEAGYGLAAESVAEDCSPPVPPAAISKTAIIEIRAPSSPLPSTRRAWPRSVPRLATSL
jgi:hypothetical protein